jgi:hypothetical protein
MDKILVSANILKEEILKEELIKEFLKVKEAFEKDPELMKLRNLITSFKDSNDKENYDKYKEIYLNHPIYQNYISLKEEVTLFLKEIVDELRI